MQLAEPEAFKQSEEAVSGAVHAIAEGRLGTMTAFTPPTISLVPLGDVVGRPRLVPVDSDTVRTARDLGIALGD